MEKHILSKSTFMRGVQCLKSLYLHKHRPFLRDKLSAEQLAKFSRGHDIGKHAHKLFPGGIDCSPSHPSQYAKAVAQTQSCIENGESIIYEAVFQHDRVLVMVDILVKHSDGWQAYEVKSSLKISDTYMLDAALQYYIVKGAGIDLKKQFLVNVNPDYIRNGEVDYNQLFVMTDITNFCAGKTEEIRAKISEEIQILDLKNSPAVQIGPQCTSPYPCDFSGFCWKNIPAESVLYMQSPDPVTKFAWHHAGYKFPDIQNTGLGAWTSEIQALSTRKPFIIKPDLQQFFKNYPLNPLFIDFVIDRPAMPPFDNTAPYEPILATLLLTDNSLHELLTLQANPEVDNRKQIIDQLFAFVVDSPKIVVWQANEFEAALKRIAFLFPETSQKCSIVISKLLDISIIIQSESIFFLLPASNNDLLRIGIGLGINTTDQIHKFSSVAEIKRKHAKNASEGSQEESISDIHNYLTLRINTLKQITGLLTSYL